MDVFYQSIYLSYFVLLCMSFDCLCISTYTSYEYKDLRLMEVSPMEDSESITQPMLQSLLERINSLEQRLNIRLDRIESEVKLVHSETLTLRADLSELRNQLKLTA